MGKDIYKSHNQGLETRICKEFSNSTVKKTFHLTKWANHCAVHLKLIKNNIASKGDEIKLEKEPKARPWRGPVSVQGHGRQLGL